MTITFFYFYLYVDTSNPNNLNENQENAHNTDCEKMAFPATTNNTSNTALGGKESSGGILNGDQNHISILQSYDSFPDGDKKGLFDSIYNY